MRKAIIVGAGMAGLFASAQLRDKAGSIFELRDSLPNNHKALLRFRTSRVGDSVGIPFKQVKVMKCISKSDNPIADALNYSFKTNGSHSLRSIVTANGEIVPRYIAPEDFITRLSRKSMARIHYGVDFFSSFGREDRGDAPVISTIPMPDLMEALNYPLRNRFTFRSIPGTVINATLKDVNAYVTMYVPQNNVEFYRVSITGNRLIVEYAWPFGNNPKVNGPSGVQEAISVLGLTNILPPSTSDIEVSSSRYAKIDNVLFDGENGDAERRKFIMWATDVHNVYSFGRFATWRPGLMMDDLVKDIDVISQIIEHGNYDWRREN